ncbi:MAG TPA: hypothetical protein DDY16_05345, partial [Tenacibaculum sp.]|nr:hypothetical protein [Tenacibaculum sp.]
LDTSGKFVDNELARIESVEVLPINSQLDEECLEKLPPGSFVFIDDFQLLTKRSQWQRVVNYCAHHFHLSIFLVVHSHQHTEGLHTALKTARNLYLTYSNNSKYFLKSLSNGKYFNFFRKHWREGIQNKHICFVNTYESVIVSYIDKLLFKTSQSPVEMSDMTDVNTNVLGDVEEKRWIITNLSDPQGEKSFPNSEAKEHDLENHFYKELSASYSKAQFPKMYKITRCLLKKGALSSDERILGKENLMDFLAFTQRFATKQLESESENQDSETYISSFGFSNGSSGNKIKKSKKSKKDKKRWKKLCHALIQHGVTIPQTLLKNPIAKKYFR